MSSIYPTGKKGMICLVIEGKKLGEGDIDILLGDKSIDRYNNVR